MIKKTCPLGHKCKTTDTDGTVIEQCMFLIQMNQFNPATSETRLQEECAVAWTPILLLENAKLLSEVRGTTESFRDEMIKSNDKATATMAAAVLVSQNKTQLLGN